MENLTKEEREKSHEQKIQEKINLDKRKKLTKKIIVYSILIIIIFGVTYMAIVNAKKPGKYDNFAKCLTEKDVKENIDTVWKKLSHGGKVLMPIGEYPFSKRYGWTQDKYGVSWQLILTDPKGEERPGIVPSILFTGDVYGKAEEAIKFYLSVFKDSKMGEIMHYGKGQEPNKEGTVMFADFKLLDLWFAAMDGGGEHKFKFNEAISFIINCHDQKEIDYYWKKLTANGGEESQCGWLKDKYGLSWQIVPKEMDEMMKGSKEQVDRVTRAFLKMKKFDIVKLKEAYEGK